MALELTAEKPCGRIVKLSLEHAGAAEFGKGRLEIGLAVDRAEGRGRDAAIVEQTEGIGAISGDETQLSRQARAGNGVVIGAIPELIPEGIGRLPRRTQRIAQREQGDDVGD